MNKAISKDSILVGRFTSAHGVRGELKLESFTQIPEAIFDYQPLYDAAGRAYRCTRRAQVGGVFVVCVEGITDRTQAETLRNTELYAKREAIPVASNEFLLADLVGLRLADEDGNLYGHISGFANYGAGDIAIIRTAEGKEVMASFTRVNFPQVDTTEGGGVYIPPEIV